MNQLIPYSPIGVDRQQNAWHGICDDFGVVTLTEFSKGASVVLPALPDSEKANCYFEAMAGDNLIFWAETTQGNYAISINIKDLKIIDTGAGWQQVERPDTGAFSIDTVYTPGKWVRSNTLVNDESYLMLSVRPNDDRARPMGQGAPFYPYDGTPSTLPVLAKQVMSGIRVMGQDPYFLEAARVETVAGNHYQVYLVRDPLGLPVFNVIADFIATIDGATIIEAGEIPIPVGTEFDIVSIVNEPNATPVTFQADYNYTTPNNAGVPGGGVIIHANRSVDLFQISKTDNGGGDLSAELEALTVGDIINGAGLSWAIQAIIDRGLYIDFTVAPAAQGSPQGVQTFTFETVQQTPITTTYETGFFAGNANLRGLYIEDGSYYDIVPDDNYRGVDIRVRAMTISDNWRFFAKAEI